MKLMETHPRYLHRHRWPALIGATLIGVSVIFTMPVAQADLFDIIFQGIRIIEISNISEAEEIELGQQINQEILQDVNLYNNSTITGYVNEIGARLVPGVNRRNIPYTFQVVEDNKINAFATLGGFVYVNTGLIRAADNEAQLASTLAHEMGHIDRRHMVEGLKQAAITEGILTSAGLERNAAVGLGVELALRRPNSRSHELEADRTGLALLTRANYAPIAATDFLKKLLDQPNNTPDFLNTHPHPEARIRALNEQLDSATATTGRGLNGSAYRDRINTLR